MPDGGATVHNAESATRYLRSKDIKPADLADFAEVFVSPEFSTQVYLPNRVEFLYELLLDRMGQPKVASFRLCEPLWRVLIECFTTLAKQSGRRATRPMKFSEILLETSRAVAEDSVLQASSLISYLRQALSVALEYSCIQLGSDQTATLIANLLKICLSLHSNHQDNATELLSTTLELYYVSNGKVSGFPRKTVDLFIKQSLSSTLQLWGFGVDPALESSLEIVVLETLYHEDQRERIQANISLLQDIPDAQKLIPRLFHLGIDRFDVKSSESLYSAFAEAFPNIAPTCLELLCSKEHIHTAEFLPGVLTAFLDSPSFNCNAVRICLQKSPEMAPKFTQQILEQIQNTESLEEVQAVITLLLKGYVVSRQLTAFIDVWSTALGSVDSQSVLYRAISSDCFVRSVGNELVLLSEVQLTTLLSGLKLSMEMTGVSEANQIPIRALLEGFIPSVSGSLDITKEKLVSRHLVAFKSKLKFILDVDSDSDSLWRSKYLYLNVYDFQDVVSDWEAKLKAWLKLKNKTEFYFYTLFRLREQFEFDCGKTFGRYLKFLNTEREAGPISMAINRWLVLFEHLMSSEEAEKLVKTVLKTEMGTVLILQSQLAFELPKLSKCIVDRILRLAESSKFELVKKNVDDIPLEGFLKRQRENLITTLCGTRPFGIDVARSVDRLLQIPTFKTSLETQPAEVFTLLKAADPEAQELVLGTFERIWKNHQRQSKETVSEKYILEMTAILTEHLAKKKSFAKLRDSGYPQVALIVASQGSELASLLFNAVESQLLSTQDEDETKWLLGALARFASDTSFPAVVDAITKSLAKSSYEIEKRLFTLHASYVPTKELLAMFLALGELTDCLDENLVSDLTRSLGNLPEQAHLSAYRYTVESLCSTSTPNHFVSLVVAFWVTARKDSVPEYHDLTVRAVSVFLTNLNSFSVPVKMKLIDGLKLVTSSKTWLISQYSLELVFAITFKMGLLLEADNSEPLYVALTHVLSNIFLFSRFRLSNRYHVIIGSLYPFLTVLFHTRETTGSQYAFSKPCADAFQRLMSNLCEPPATNSSTEASLTAPAAALKAVLRKHLPVFLIKYVHLRTTQLMSKQVRAQLESFIYVVFDVLSQNELILVSASLDSAGRSTFRALTEDYRKFGKWRDD